MSSRLRKVTLLVSLIFAISSMSVMLLYAKDKTIVIGDGAEVLIESEQRQGNVKQEQKSLLFRSGTEQQDGLCIPLGEGTKAENVIIENHYVTKEIWILMKNGKASFYDSQAISGNVQGIQAGTYESTQAGALLKFQMSDYYECKSVLENNQLYITLQKPKEIYEEIVVIDPVGGGTSQESQWALDIVKQLKAKLDATDTKVYYTRLDDSNPTTEQRMELANGVEADFYIAIGFSQSQDTDQYGTEVVYNDGYYVPGFGSVALADLLEREVVTQICGRGNGLFASSAEEVDILDIVMPGAKLKAGYLSNSQEARLLAREDYRGKIAQGIFQTIEKALEQMEE